MEKRRYISEQTSDEHFLVVPGEHTERIDEGRLHLLTVASPRIDRTSRYRILFNTRVIRDYLREVRPDVIEAGDPYHVAWALLRAGRELGVPVLGFYHSHFPDAYLRTILKYGGSALRDAVMRYAVDYIYRLYSQFETTLVPSENLCQLLQNWGVTNAVCTRLGVDTAAFHPAPPETAFRTELGIPADVKLLLYVGRLSGEKNVTTLLAAFTKLCEKEKRKYWLLIVGDGPLRRLLPAVQESTGALTWRPFVDRSEDLARFYHAADLFVHPGVVETFGLVSLESQACGCPVIGIRGTNMDANILAGLEHWSWRNTPEDLAAAVKTALAQDLIAWGQLAAVRVVEKFAWPIVFQNMWKYYCAPSRIVA